MSENKGLPRDEKLLAEILSQFYKAGGENLIPLKGAQRLCWVAYFIGLICGWFCGYLIGSN
jgi:hypothetical protein